MSKSKEYLNSLGLSWRNDKGYEEMYEAVPIKLWNKMLKYDKRKSNKESDQFRFNVLSYIFQEERSLFLSDLSMLKEDPILSSQISVLPEKLVKDACFSFSSEFKPTIIVHYPRMLLNEYFDFNMDKKEEFYCTIMPNYHLSKKTSIKMTNEILLSKLKTIGEELGVQISETGINNKLKYRLLDLLVEDYLEKNLEQQSGKKNILTFIKEMANSL